MGQKHEAVQQDARATMCALLPTITRAVHGQLDEQQIFETATSAMTFARELLLVLRLSEDRKRVRVAAASIGENVGRAIEVFIGAPLETQRKRLANLPTMMEALEGDLARTASVSQLCREAFEPDVAGKVAGLLGGGAGRAILCPISAPTDTHEREVIGGLCLVATGADDYQISATAQLAETLSAALSTAKVLRTVRHARSVLSADHSAQHHLGAALRIYGHGTPQGPRSLIPQHSTVTLRPPPNPKDSWLPRGAEAALDDGAGARILLVEDEQRVRESTSNLLRHMGYRVDGVATGEHAIATYTRAKDQHQPFDLVLMDQTLGGRIGGVETLRILRSVDPDVRAILLSGQDPARGREQVDRFGFQQCLEKPVAMQTLSDAIERTLSL